MDVDLLSSEGGVRVAPAQATPIVCLQEFFEGVVAIEEVPGCVARRRAYPQARQSKLYPSRTREESAPRHFRQHNSPFTGLFGKPSDGLEPPTPPYRVRGRAGSDRRVRTFVRRLRRARSTRLSLGDGRMHAGCGRDKMRKCARRHPFPDVSRVCCVIKEMRVRVQRDARPGVAKNPTDVGDVKSEVHDQVAGERVSKVVKP